jgi:hypothetical protein
MQITRQDGFTNIVLADESFERGIRLSKGEPTGVGYRKYTFTVKTDKLESAPRVDTPEGVVAIKKLTVLEETVDPAAIARKAEAKRFRNLAVSIRKRTVLVGKAKFEELAERERLTVGELTDWADGKVKVNGYDFAALPEETQGKIAKVIEELRERETKPVKASATQKAVAELLNKLVAENPSITIDEALKAMGVGM